MFDMFSVAGRCRKSQRFPAFIIACVVTVIIAVLLFITVNHGIDAFSSAHEASINYDCENHSISAVVSQ